MWGSLPLAPTIALAQFGHAIYGGCGHSTAHALFTRVTHACISLLSGTSSSSSSDLAVLGEKNTWMQILVPSPSYGKQIVFSNDLPLPSLSNALYNVRPSTYKSWDDSVMA